MKVTRALISVSNKEGLEELARRLVDQGIELISTGGTHHVLQESGIPVKEISKFTGFPEMMDGRVKTLHPRVHGGILGRRGVDDKIMSENGIGPIDMVVVNLYPFAETIAREDCTEDLAIENIDIGGPAMIRSSAKNFRDVIVVVDPSDYEAVISRVVSGDCSLEFRRELAVKAFRHTAKYDSIVSAYLGQAESFPGSLTLSYDKVEELRYGENPHQQAAFYRESNAASSGVIANYRQLHGKELSYNNIADTDAALECVKVFEDPACVIVKHANPCGVSVASTSLKAYEQAFSTDPTSAFGGIVAFNRVLEAGTVSKVLENQFVEVLIAPAIDEAALEIAETKKNVRLLECGDLVAGSDLMSYKKVGGGLLVQNSDLLSLSPEMLKVVSKVSPTEEQMRDLLFAWKVAWFVKSNAIVYARNLKTVGVGAGQMSRVVSAKIAGLKAKEEGLEVTGSVMASDAFFPFRDGIDAAAKEGIVAVIQPGGSMRDKEVIEAADEHEIAMVFTGTRHFRH